MILMYIKNQKEI